MIQLANKDKISQKEKILSVLRKARPLDLTQAEIARKTGMHRHTVIVYLEQLVKEGKIKKTREIGKYKLYTIGK